MASAQHIIIIIHVILYAYSLDVCNIKRLLLQYVNSPCTAVHALSLRFSVTRGAHTLRQYIVFSHCSSARSDAVGLREEGKKKPKKKWTPRARVMVYI